MSTFFIADTHFGDDTIRRYENRPFDSVEEMDRALVENWNNCVKDGDTVFMLGDFSSGGDERDRELLGQLCGKKILIMGNHDMHRAPEKWRELGFDEVSEYPIIYKGFFILSHEPLYVCRNMPYANIFGHVHGNPSYKDSSEQSICVSVERIGYSPIEFEEAFKIIKG